MRLASFVFTIAGALLTAGGTFPAPRSVPWSLAPLQPLQPPEAVPWARGPVDAFVAARLTAAGLSPSGDADRATLVRRLHLDVLGLPPSPEQVTAFAEDSDPLAYERCVDGVLASPRYGERWAAHWLDVVRFAETNGFEMNQPRENAWPYRDYVIRSLNEDKPYDRFLREQLAGDQLGEDAATGYLVAGAWDQVKSPDPQLTAQQRQDELADMVATTGTAFLGLTVGCARCHDHKFDPITTADYYGLQAVFAGVQHGDRETVAAESPERTAKAKALRRELAEVMAQLWTLEPLADAAALPGGRARRSAVSYVSNVDRFSPVEAKVVRFTVLETTSGEPCIDELEVYSAGPGRRNVAGASAGGRARASSLLPGFEIHQIEHANDERYGNSRSWISAERGKGWLELELAEATVVDGVVWGRDREGKFRDRLATAYRIDVAPAPGGPWRTVATSADRELFREAPADPSPAAAPATAGRLEGTDRVEVLRLQRARLERELNAATAAEKVYAGQFAQPPETHVLARGDPAQAREIARPGAIACLGRPFALGPPAAEAERRLALARWIAAPLQPLAARVIVNRIWQHHFGEGIVATPDDFGANGAAPSHPELLEWLAAELLRGGCSLKKLHRELLLSSAYRQSSRPSPEGLAADAQNRLLWRFSPQRLEAEAIHDAVLSVAGSLDLGMGGHGFSPFEPNDNYVRVYEPKKTFGPREWRRMVYEQRVRMQRDATFGAFDFPDGGQVCPRRARSTTPLQALSLLNSKFLTDQADILAARIAGDAGQDRAAQVRRAFALAFGREPEPDEAFEAARLAGEHGLQALARALFNSNEFLFLD